MKKGYIVLACLLCIFMGFVTGYSVRFIQGEKKLEACQVELAILQGQVDMITKIVQDRAMRYHHILMAFLDKETKRILFIRKIDGKPCRYSVYGRD